MAVTFDELLDAVDHLSPDEQAELIAVVQRRLAEQGRRRVAEEVRAGRAEFRNGSATPTTAADLIREIGS